MLTVSTRLAITARLLTIITDTHDDRTKAATIEAQLNSLRANHDVEFPRDIILILQTEDGCNGSKNSLMHTAIRLGLPYTFDVLYKSAGGPSALSQQHRQAYHGPNNFKLAMSSVDCFSSHDVGVGFGPGNPGEPTCSVSTWDVMTNRVFTWYDLFCFESEHEINILKVDATIALADRLAARNIRLPANTPVNYETVQNPDTGEVTFIARSRLHPEI